MIKKAIFDNEIARIEEETVSSYFLKNDIVATLTFTTSKDFQTNNPDTLVELKIKDLKTNQGTTFRGEMISKFAKVFEILQKKGLLNERES